MIQLKNKSLNATWIQSSGPFTIMSVDLREGVERQLGLVTPGQFVCFVRSEIHLICYFLATLKNGLNSNLELAFRTITSIVARVVPLFLAFK